MTSLTFTIFQGSQWIQLSGENRYTFVCHVLVEVIRSSSRAKEHHDFPTHAGATGGSQKELGKSNIVLLNELGAAQSIPVKNLSVDQHRTAFIPLGECLGLCQTTYAQCCGHERICLVDESVE